jgi:hypothetical protein
LGKFSRRLFYFYFDDAKYKFRKEPNVTSLHHTYRVNLGDTDEVDAYINKVILESALGSSSSPLHGFNQVYFLPNRTVDRDDDTLKLVVLGFDHTLTNGQLSDTAHQTVMAILKQHGQILRQHKNTMVFCTPNKKKVAEVRQVAADFLSWRKIQQNEADWDRIGGAQQAVVKEQMTETESAAKRGFAAAYDCALIPVEDKVSEELSLNPVSLGHYGPGSQIAPMVWESLISKGAGVQSLLRELTPDTFLQRYGAKAWPEHESWVTTKELWDRFTSQVSLPILTGEQVLLETLRQAQYEGLLAIGLLAETQSPRDQRDSYIHLHFKETLSPNVPLIGERWLIMRPSVYRQIAKQPVQITQAHILTAIAQLGGGDHPVQVKTVRKIVAAEHNSNIDEASFHQSVTEILQSRQFVYMQGQQKTAELPEDETEALEGTLVKETEPAPQTKSGRTIVIKGDLGSINDMGPFFKKILQPIATQGPSELTISLHIHAHFEDDPGSGLDATLDDGFDNDAFPGLIRVDSKK